ncbi:MAG: glycoside hydrolase family 15 protein [Myxococcales bacterium]|nr:glycoside hydrolase family 15 protein [Myxococcales bacterium]
MSDHLDHGLIGNGRVLALVAPDTGVEWLCLPRFDGEAVFAALLDSADGGVWRVAPVDPGPARMTRYLPDSRVLETTFITDVGEVRVTDFCPAPPLGEDPRAELVRLIEPLDGVVNLRVEFDPRPGYGARRPALAARGDRVLIEDDLCLSCSHGAAAVIAGQPFRLDRPLVMVLSHGEPTVPPVLQAAQAALEATLAADRRACEPAAPEHRRDVLTLLSLCHTPTGAIIAAGTTSVPEALGTPRTWDYRFAWIRDGAFTAEALARLGQTAPAAAFLDFLARTVGAAPQPLYGIGGERSLPERALPHLAGFAGTGPVRVGNAAAGQVQHDSYGQIVWLASRLFELARVPVDDDRFAWLAGLVDRAAAVADTPDAGIWEFRDRPGRYTYSQVWCWVALDRGATLAAARGDSERAARWRTQAQALRERILAAADRVGFFAQTLDGADVDASSLQFGQLGLVPPTDPRFVATVRRCEQALLVDGLMRRYVAEDDFGETTSTFSICTLWWIEALAAIDERARARQALAAFEDYGNPLGLFAEDVDPRLNRQLGNFPQAYTHLALLNARLAVA